MTLEHARPSRAPRARRVAVFAFLLLAVGAGALAALLRDAPRVPPPDPPGLADLWDGRAVPVLDKKWTSAGLGLPRGGAYAGAHIEVVDATWYLFNRRGYPGQGCEGYDASFTPLGTDVRASSDRGRTWGAPATILAPTPGSPWACAATDGDAVFDRDSGTWRYLFQCLGSDRQWSGCMAERQDASPLGAFAPTPGGNPVISSGGLWERICDDPEDGCRRGPGAQPIREEGTFDVFRFDGEGWWVGFHGYDGRRGYRGIARTTTFRRGDWEVDGAGGTPTDAVLDAGDAAQWRETWRAGGPVGAGAASVLADGEWHYQVAEFPDVDLACTPGQTWDLGLFRTQRLSSSRWQQYPGGNPIVHSSRAPDGGNDSPPCSVAYPRLFEDPMTGVTYLMHGRMSSDPAYDAIYVYRLEWNRNMLSNGDFQRADAEAWRALDGTPAQLSVERAPDGSPDGTPYLAFNCGAAVCDGGASVHQDVPIDPERVDGTLAFGGSFRADAGSGHVDVAVQQLDAAGRVLGTTAQPATVGSSYSRARGTLSVDPRARRLRFELYPRTPGTLRADNLYLIPQDGCKEPRYPAC